MSNARKLQTEIDRVMKKVDEGSELFDEIWLKVKSADSQNLKEKHEVDLKKEIKKLQRLRDQIKTWIGSSDVKDKDSLIEARKLIETKMETFKICEKETKTKTYSKEGLAREDKLDPVEEAKMKTTGWLQEYVDKFQEQVEEKDFEIEKLSSGKGKKTNKHHIEDKQEHITNHRFHINKLEGIIRLVNNDVIEVDAVDAIKDDLDYHLESYEDDDYRAAYDEEFFYETLGLEDIDVGVPLATVPSKKTEDAVSVTSSKGSRDLKSNKKASSVIPLTIGRARSSKADKKAEAEEEKEKVASPPKKTAPAMKPAPASAPRASTTAAPGASMAAILKRETELQEKERQKQEQIRLEQIKQEQMRQQQIKQQQQEQLRQQEAMRVQLAEEEAAAAVAAREREQLESQQRAAAEQTAALQSKQPTQPVAAVGQTNALEMLTTGLGGLGLGAAPEPRNGDSASVLGSLTQSSTSTLKTATSGSETSGSSYLTALNESFVSAPGTGDAERSRQYTPQNPYPTLPSYPTNPSPIFDNPAVFEKLGTDCLFFIFYYAQGTYQQYLAARELKKQSWRFHKKYQAWFQRHEEPKITTDEYEQGTYVYFDYETGWCTRIKQDFRFEYSYLEDSLQ